MHQWVRQDVEVTDKSHLVSRLQRVKIFTLREMRSVRVTLCHHIRLRRGTTQRQDYDHSSKATRAGGQGNPPSHGEQKLLVSAWSPAVSRPRGSIARQVTRLKRPSAQAGRGDRGSPAPSHSTRRASAIRVSGAIRRKLARR